MGVSCNQYQCDFWATLVPRGLVNKIQVSWPRRVAKLESGTKRDLKTEPQFFMVRSMATLCKTPANAERVKQVERMLAEILAEALRRGFHGTVSIEVNVQDGTIQQIRHRVDQIER